MSLFLGKIHYWLYNKILWFEAIESNIVKWAGENGFPTEPLGKQIHDAYGVPTGGKPLEEIIDSSNIHGWLQQKIENAELRQAAWVTAILKKDPNFKKALIHIFEKQGKAAAQDYDAPTEKPRDIYTALNDFILEGMPCDRVDEILVDNDDEFVWKTTRCLHQTHWKSVNGDVQHFYDLRESWLNAFAKTLSPSFVYEKSSENTRRIARKK